MTEQELIQRTRKLTQGWDGIRIVGAGWAGDTRRGFQFNPLQAMSGAGEEPIPPSITGACCPEDGDCFITSQEICEGGGGTYQGDGTDCDPDPCPPPTPTGACCVDTDCTIETEDDCTGMGGTYQGDDTTCDPNPCGGIIPTECCSVAFDAFDSSGRKFLRYQRTISGTTHSEEHNGCSPPDNNDVVIDASCSATFEQHYETTEPCSLITDVDSSSSDHTFTSNGSIIDSCSIGDMECFCGTIPPFNQCDNTTFYGEVTNCACGSPSNSTVTTATTRVSTHTYNEDCSVPCFVCVGCENHCTASVSYVVTETLSDECS